MTRILAAVALVLWLSSPAFAEDVVPANTADPKLRVEVQFELVGGNGRFGGEDKISVAAYGVGGVVDYALTRHLSIGFAPRLVYSDHAGEELDLRAQIRAHTDSGSGLQAYIAFSPGYAALLVDDARGPFSKGYAVGGAAGITLDAPSQVFISVEVGYQYSFTRTHEQIDKDAFVTDLELSYFHIGVGVGRRF
jgi:opacity protein-like surface antigen